MAVGFETFERLEKGFDRLERFFSKKKREKPQNLVITETIPSNKSDGFIPTFPSPSFISPMSSRMIAREEVNLSGGLARRAHSLPEPSGSSYLISMTTNISTNVNHQLPNSSGYPGVPQRAASTSTRTTSNGLERLLEFSFSMSARKESEDSLRPSRRSGPGSKRWSRCSSASVSPGAPVNRKRCSMQHETLRSPSPRPDVSHPSASGEQDQAMPLSPRLIPLPEPTPDEFEMDLDFNFSESKPIPGTASTDLVPQSLSILSKADTILKEPTVDDFLSLSDDDIADGYVAPGLPASRARIPNFPLPPNSPARLRTPSPPTSDTYPFLTLSPPLASRPAAAAAFEAAKLATKYRFDLVYIVNLWPKGMGYSQYRPSRRQSQTETPSPPASPISGAGSTSTSTNSSPAPRQSVSQRAIGGGRLTGRLLAAYGLTSLMYPFRISEPVHQKVLTTDGWLEYRGDTDADYFTRGYSCSFYTGHSPNGSSGNNNKPDDRRRRRSARAANRGIVFAAYRRPSADGGACTQSDAGELESLYRDAEQLVDMLIDIHMTHRRPSLTLFPRCVETGPPPLASSKMTMPLVAA